MSYYYQPSMGPGSGPMGPSAGAPSNGLPEKQSLFAGPGQPPSLGHMYGSSNMTPGMASRPSPLGHSSHPSYPSVSYGQAIPGNSPYGSQSALGSQAGLYSPYAQQSLVQSQQSLRPGMPSGLNQSGAQSMLGSSLQPSGLQHSAMAATSLPSGLPPSGLQSATPSGMPQPGHGLHAGAGMQPGLSSGLSSNPYLASIPNSRNYSGLTPSSVYPGAGYSQSSQYGISGVPPSVPSPTYPMNRGVPSYPSHLQAPNPSYPSLAQGVPSMGPQAASGFPVGSPYGGMPL